jgi:tape measure domain-containing protein
LKAAIEQSSALGAKTETLDAIVREFGQAWARGKLQGDGIRTLVSVGYMVDQIVEITTGKDGKAVERTLTWAEFEAEQKALHGDNFTRAGTPAA